MTTSSTAAQPPLTEPTSNPEPRIAEAESTSPTAHADGVIPQEVRSLYEKLASSPLGMSTPWERKASNGKPLLYGGKRGLLAYGTIATWDEFDLIVGLVNALPKMLAAVSPAPQSDSGWNDQDRALFAKIKSGLHGWVKDRLWHTIAGHCGDLIRLIEKAPAPPVSGWKTMESARAHANATWQSIEHLLTEECGLMPDEGLAQQRENCVSAIANSISAASPSAELLTAVAAVLRGGAIHKVRVAGKMMTREQMADALVPLPQPRE